MTNEHDQHEQEGMAVEGHEQESWQGGEVPDDFSDATAHDEGEQVVVAEEGSPEDEGVVGDQSTVVNQPKKASPLLPAAIGVVALAFIGGVLYLQFGGNVSAPVAVSEPAQVADADQAMMPDDGAAPPTRAPAPSSDAAMTPTNAGSQPTDIANLKPQDGATANVPGLEAGQQLKDPSTAPVVTPVAEVAPPSPSTPNTAPVVTTGSTPVVVPADGSAIVAVSVPTPADAKSAAPVAENQAASTNTAPTVAAPVAANDDLKKKVDDLQKTIDQLNQQVAETSSLRQQNTDLQDRVTKLEHDLADARAAMAPVAKPAATRTASRHKVSTAKRHVTHTASAKKTTVSKPASGLVLRAATPNEAWVSENGSSTELRHVVVGDTLPGIGKVVAIEQGIGGSWMLMGTSGQLR